MYFSTISIYSMGRAQSALQIGARLSKALSLGVSISCALISLSLSYHADASDFRVDAGYLYDSNVTRAQDPADKLSDHSYSVNLSKPVALPVSTHTRVLLSANLGGEKFANYNGLTHTTGGVQGMFQYRPSAQFYAPTLSVFARGYADHYQSNLRSGSRNSEGISMRQPVTDRIQLFGAWARNQRNAYSSVFCTEDHSLRLNLDYAATPGSTIYLTGERRHGDTVSTGVPTLALIDLAKALVQDNAYPGGQLYSYRFIATTMVTTLGYNIGISTQSALDISWLRAKSTADYIPSSAVSAPSYVTNQFSIVYLLRL